MFEELKTLVKTTLGPGWDLIAPLISVLVPFGGPHNLNWVFVVSTLVLVLAIYITSIERGSRRSVRGFLGFLAPRAIYLHPSAVLDYKFYVVNSLFLSQLRLGAWVGSLVGLFYVADGARHLLNALLGPGPEPSEPSLGLRLLFTLSIVAAADFAKFLAHYLQHKVPVLWEFHKVHHSAEVLTPITNYRLHPVDFMLEQFLVGIFVGVVAGTFGYFVPEGIADLTILSIGLVYFLFFLQSNLRHSHIPVAFGRRTSYVLSSPVMHQVHHSAESRHFDKNFALIFSFWDYLFRSLYIPRSKEEFRLGLGPEGGCQGLDSLGALYFRPFAAALGKLREPSPSGSGPAA
jgi:sterol desaturase/sphingolipid hydroxylase (fatty acid hydroxylase superfamily)